MVVFNPPLGTHLTVDLPATSSSSSSPSSTPLRITITFSADDPEHKVGPDDKVQLWTNAPDILGEKQEWRAVLFEPVEVDSGSRDDDQADEPTDVDRTSSVVFPIPGRASVPASSIPFTPPDTQSDRRRQAILDIPLPETAGGAQSLDFEYTFRILYPDGNIWWLGGMGVNGTVSFKEGESSDAVERDEQVVWDHSGWSGFALQVDQDSFTTVILPLPTTASSTLPESHNVLLAYLSKDTETEITSTESPFSRVSRGTEDEQVVVLSNAAQHNVIEVTPDEIKFDKGLTEVIRTRTGFTEAFAQTKQDWLSATGLNLIPSSSIMSRDGQDAMVLSHKSSKDGRIISPVPRERWLVASMFRKKGMGKAAHRVGIDLSARGLDASASGRFALWQDEAQRAMLLPGYSAQAGGKQTVVLDLQGDHADRTRVGHVDLVSMVEFGSRGLIGAINVSAIEWVEEKEWEEVEEYEEEVNAGVQPGMASGAEPAVIPDAKGQQSKVIRRLLDHVIDDIEGGRHDGQSRDQSARATVGSSSSVASTVTNAELQELREDMLLSPRTVDLHEVEDPARGELAGDETPVGKESKAPTTVNTSEDEDEGKQVLPIGSMESARSGSEEEEETDDASEGGTLVNPPSLLVKSWRWLVIFFRGFWLRTLGWFKWMFGSTNASAEDKPNSKTEMVDESTPLLSKPSDDEQSAAQDPVPESLFAREAVPEPVTQEQEIETGSEGQPGTPPEVPAPAIEALPLETSEPVPHRMVKKTRTKTIIEPGYMRLMFAGSQGHVTLLTDLTETLKVIHRTAGSDDVALNVSVKPADEGGLNVLKVDTGDLKDRIELVVLMA